MTPDWLKFKKYPHIGNPLTKKKDLAWIKNYVTNPDKISKHKFTPLLHKKICQRKFRPAVGTLKTPMGKRFRTVHDKKERPIFYASHLDSIVYSYYSHLLTAAYEKFLSAKSFGISAVAYRQIPISNIEKGNKCNVEFAYDTFKFIEDNKHRKLSILVADITSFFDNLDHRILHSQWKRILELDSLPDDHYTVYKSLIVKRYVNELDLFNRFKHNLIAERGVESQPGKVQLKNVRVKKIWNLKREAVVAYCTKKDFYSKATDLIRAEKSCSHQHKICRSNCEIKGIPQGTPLSATLANIYMLDFDEKVYHETQKKQGYYQRYSDDLIIVCDQEDETFFYELICEAVERSAKLNIQRKKTNIYRYSLTANGFTGGIVENGVLNANRQLEYLGFMYDGRKIRVKTIGFSRFYRSMKRAFRRGTHFASKPSNKSHNLFENRLYKRFSYKGAKRRLIYKPDNKSPNGYKKTKEQYWGNYISYLQKANRVMKTINGDDTIKKQYSKFWVKFGSEMKKAYLEIARKVLSR